MLVVIGLGIAVGVLLLLFMLTKLIRSVRAEDEFRLRRGRRFRRRGRSKPSLVVPLPPTQDPSNGDAALQASRTSTLERVAAYAPTKGSAQESAASVPSKRSVSVKQFGQSKAENARRSDQQARSERNPEGGSNDYARLGEQVTAVLTTAEQAAAEIRASANRDAENIRREAEKQAAASRAQAEALRADADAYGKRTRTTADAYAEQTRRRRSRSGRQPSRLRPSEMRSRSRPRRSVAVTCCARARHISNSG